MCIILLSAHSFLKYNLSSWVFLQMFWKPVFSLQMNFSLQRFLSDASLEKMTTGGYCFSAAVNSPVEVVGNVDVALCSGQQEHDKGAL